MSPQRVSPRLCLHWCTHAHICSLCLHRVFAYSVLNMGITLCAGDTRVYTATVAMRHLHYPFRVGIPGFCASLGDALGIALLYAIGILPCLCTFADGSSCSCPSLQTGWQTWSNGRMMCCCCCWLRDRWLCSGAGDQQDAGLNMADLEGEWQFI